MFDQFLFNLKWCYYDLFCLDKSNIFDVIQTKNQITSDWLFLCNVDYLPNYPINIENVITCNIIFKVEVKTSKS